MRTLFKKTAPIVLSPSTLRMQQDVRWRRGEYQPSVEAFIVTAAEAKRDQQRSKIHLPLHNLAVKENYDATKIITAIILTTYIGPDFAT